MVNLVGVGSTTGWVRFARTLQRHHLLLKRYSVVEVLKTTVNIRMLPRDTNNKVEIVTLARNCGSGYLREQYRSPVDFLQMSHALLNPRKSFT